MQSQERGSVVMTDALMRALHVPWWLPFLFWFGGYALVTFFYVVNGYAQEYLGWRHPGRPGKIHNVLIKFHTGAHIHPDKSYGDEMYRSRMSGSRGTVYWTKRSRRFRAVRNNLIVFAVLLILSTMVAWPADTVRGVTLLILGLCALWLVLAIRDKRRRHAARRPVIPKPLTRTVRAKLVLEADETTAGPTVKPALDEGKPELESVPATVLATLLGAKMGCSSADMLSRLTLTSEEGKISPLPETYSAVLKGREDIQEIIEAHTVGRVGFRWRTTQVPRELTWNPVRVHSLPSMVRFRDYLPQMEKLGARDFGVGVVADRGMYVASHNGDFPWHCRFAGPGTGKTTGFLVKAAQICHQDPQADLYCVDTKQISFAPLRGIPGIHIYDKPQSEMDKIWGVWYDLLGIMRDRYTAVAEGRITLADLNDIYILIDEGNDLAAWLKSYNRNVLGNTAAPAIWGEAIAPIMRVGRQARMFGEFMCQDLDGRMFAGETLKTAFNLFGAAGFSPAQFSRTIGGKAEDCLVGPGKILMIRGNTKEWVQAFYDDEQFLHDYALENRKEKAA